MAYLYCNIHGEDIKESEYGNGAVFYEGEYTKIAYGEVNSEYVCDKCNAPIHVGENAYLFQFCLESDVDQLESQYFDRSTIQIFPEKYWSLFDKGDEFLTINEIADTDHYFNENKIED